MTDTPTGGPDPAEPTQPQPIEAERLDPPGTGAPSGPADTPPAAGTPTAETPTAETPTPTAAPTAPVATTVAQEQPSRRQGVTIPLWALAVVAALVVFGGGYLIGHAVGDGGHDGRSSARFVRPGNGRFGANQSPFGPNYGFGPFGGRNGSSNGNGNGRGNGSSPSASSQAFLGVGVSNAANSGGAQITTVVSSGPAADAGLTRGDVITAIDGTKVTDVATLRSAIAGHQPGDSVKVTYTRDGAAKTVDATLGDRNSSNQ
jgi:membrane-associated protease RseP (regulator of RpoE activity)